MSKMTHYSRKNGNTQDELQSIARTIFESGKIEDVTHQWATEYHPDGKTIERNTGGLCFTVKSEGIPIRYWIHLTGFTVYEIIEEVSA